MAILWSPGNETEYVDYVDGKSVYKPRATWDGLVLGKEVRDERIMSDVWAYITYAKVWSPDEGRVKLVAVGNSEFGSSGSFEVDASDEVKALAAAWEAKELAKRRLSDKISDISKRVEAAKLPSRGKRVKVVRGRKVAKGLTGLVFWAGEGRWGWRVGFTPDGGGEAVWTDRKNVEVIDDAASADLEVIEKGLRAEYSALAA